MRLQLIDQLKALIEVSIHASVKDATIDFGEFYKKVDVSIHASVKDATRDFRQV